MYRVDCIALQCTYNVKAWIIFGALFGPPYVVSSLKTQIGLSLDWVWVKVCTFIDVVLYVPLLESQAQWAKAFVTMLLIIITIKWIHSNENIFKF